MEYERVSRGEPLSAIDTKRYKLEMPSSSEREDLGSWKHAVENAYSQCEHQYLR
jgi:pre-mRNA-splicing factor SPF27